MCGDVVRVCKVEVFESRTEQVRDRDQRMKNIFYVNLVSQHWADNSLNLLIASPSGWKLVNGQCTEECRSC